jgi:predicted NUDIX family NTP pyrophosphohydrolase
MPQRVSAGIVAYRVRNGALEVFLAHPGGPFFVHKDAGHWTIPKGEVEPGEDLLAAALREFHEEIGIALDPNATYVDLGSIQQKGGKLVRAWAVPVAWDASPTIKSNLFKMEWPNRSGQWKEFPEVDRAQFFPLAEAKRKLKERQVPLLDRLAGLIETD